LAQDSEARGHSPKLVAQLRVLPKAVAGLREWVPGKRGRMKGNERDRRK